jgi:hypothetical protein
LCGVTNFLLVGATGDGSLFGICCTLVVDITNYLSLTYCTAGASRAEWMRREREAYEDALAIIRQFNARLSVKKTAWFWPTVGAALASKHHWLIISCDACGTIIDLDLTVKRRDPDAPVRVALNDVRCPRCNGHGRTRIVGLSRYPSV